MAVPITLSLNVGDQGTNSYLDALSQVVIVRLFVYSVFFEEFISKKYFFHALVECSRSYHVVECGWNFCNFCQF